MRVTITDAPGVAATAAVSHHDLEVSGEHRKPTHHETPSEPHTQPWFSGSSDIAEMQTHQQKEHVGNPLSISALSQQQQQLQRELEEATRLLAQQQSAARQILPEDPNTSELHVNSSSRPQFEVAADEDSEAPTAATMVVAKLRAA